MLTNSVTVPLALAASLLAASSASAHPGSGHHHNQVRHAHAHAGHAHAKRAFVPVREALNARAVGAAARMQRKVRRASSSSSNSTSSASSSSTTKYSSTAIWWAEAGWVGSCGVTINESDMVVALPLSVYPDVSSASPLCGSSVTVTSPSTGKSIAATVVGASDRTDYTTFSKAAYLALEGDLDQGELPIEFDVDSSKVPAASSSSSSDVAAAKVANVKVAQTTTTTQAAAAQTTTTTTQAPKVQAPTTTQAPAPTSTASADESGDDWVCDSEDGESSTSAPAPTADAAAVAASSKAAADAAASSKAAADAAASSKAAAQAAASSKAAADAAASSSSAAAAAAVSSSSAAAAAAASSKAAAQAAQAQPTQVADTSSGSNLSLLSKAGVKGFLGTNTGAILSWYHTDSSQDSTNGNSWCGFPYDDSVPGVAPSLKTMLNNFGGDYQAAATAYCGLEVVVTTPEGKSATLYIADAFDDTWVRTPSSLDLIYGAFTSLYGQQTSDKNVVIQNASWKFTGNRNSKYAFKSTTSLS